MATPVYSNGKDFAEGRPPEDLEGARYCVKRHARQSMVWQDGGCRSLSGGRRQWLGRHRQGHHSQADRQGTEHYGLPGHGPLHSHLREITTVDEKWLRIVTGCA